METVIPRELKDFDKLIKQAQKSINGADSLSQLNDLKLKLIVGKNSFASRATIALGDLPEKLRQSYGRRVGPAINQLKSLEKERRIELLRGLDAPTDDFDITWPVKPEVIGHLSPDTQVIRRMNDFFHYHGYSVAEGPEIESDEYNFEKTNLPVDHPARDLQDTIYIESPQILLRTHTSSVETRILSHYPPPLRFVVPGLAFRNEIINPSNHAIFQQYQGVLVDRGISLGNLKATLEEFAKYMYGPKVKTRFRTKYYPEVEPGAGMDILCTFCRGEGCRICKGRGWIEILGSGLIHRQLLEKCGLDYRVWSGFAFGMGLDRIIMTKFGIEDIRSLHDGSLVFPG